MNYNEAFANNGFEELDKMSHAMANKRKNMYKQVNQSNKMFEKELRKGVEACYSDPEFNFLPVGGGRQGDFSSGLPTPMDEMSVESSVSDSDNKMSCTRGLSDSMSLLATSESDVSTIYSSLPKKAKRRLKSSTDHLRKYSEKDDKHVLSHLQKCGECRRQLFRMFKDNGHVVEVGEPQLTPVVDKKETGGNESVLGMNYTELRDIIIMVMIGIIIIIFVDMVR